MLDSKRCSAPPTGGAAAFSPRRELQTVSHPDGIVVSDYECAARDAHLQDGFRRQHEWRAAKPASVTAPLRPVPEPEPHPRATQGPPNTTRPSTTTYLLFVLLP